MSRSLSRTILLASLLVACAWPESARAESAADADRAAARIKEGTAALQRDDPASARRAFAQAYELTHRPAYLYNVGLAAVRAHEDANAATAFSDFLALAADARPEHRRFAEEQLRGLRRTLTEVVVASPQPGATVALDQTVRGQTPELRPLWVVPGEHALRVSKPGFLPVERPFRAAANQTVRFDVALLPDPGAGRQAANGVMVSSTDRPANENPPLTSRWWFWTAVGGAVVAGVLVAVLASGGTRDCVSGVNRCLTTAQ